MKLDIRKIFLVVVNTKKPPNELAIVLGAFHKKEMEQMLVFVKDEIKKHSLTIIREVWVPGSMEKPLAVKKLLLNKGIDAVAVLGIIEKLLY